MQIVNVTTGDTGNQSYLLSQAINETTPHRSRSFVRSSYFEWPMDVRWRPEWDGSLPDWIQAYWQEADVVHLHNRWQRAKYWAGSPNAAWIVHQHGRWPDRKRFDLELAIDEERGAIRVVSTPNLLPYVDWRLDRWFPRPVTPILPPRARWNSPLHIVHAPTVKAVKQTSVFVEVADELTETHGITYDIVTQTPHLECMVRKARADVLFDQLSPGFGTNALEAWAIGIPAIAGVCDELHDFISAEVGEPPYVRAQTKDELREALLRLIEDADYRKRMAAVGNHYVRRWHDPSVCANIAIRTYKEAIG